MSRGVIRLSLFNSYLASSRPVLHGNCLSLHTAPHREGVQVGLPYLAGTKWLCKAR